MEDLILHNFNLKISNDSNLFEYGFNSLNILTLSNIINDYYLVNITPKIIYQNPILKDMKKIINNEKNTRKNVICEKDYYYERQNLLSNILLVFFCGRCHDVGSLKLKKLSNRYNINYIKIMDKKLNFHIESDWRNIVNKIKNKHNYKYLIGVSNSMGGLVHILNLNSFNYNFVSAPVSIEYGRLIESLGNRLNNVIQELKNMKLTSLTYFLCSVDHDWDARAINTYINYINSKNVTNKNKIKFLISHYTPQRHGYFNGIDEELDIFQLLYKN